MARESKNKPRRASVGKEYVIAAYLFVALFVALIGYIVYFNIQLRDDLLSSAYNKRQDAQEERVIRGSIVSSDGAILAKTEVDGEANEKRVYPFENIFAHIVGYSTRGRSGLEAVLNKDLLSSHEAIIDQVQQDIKAEKKSGDTVITTLDTKMQRAAYDALGDYRGAIVVMEPSTGKILAMVSKPDFNPNNIAYNWEELVAEGNNSQLLNRATQGMYAPGSTFKVVTSLAYLKEHGNVNDFYFDCEGEITIEGHTVHCYNNNVHGGEDYFEAFAKSCNGAFAEIGADLGWNKMRATAEQVLFNETLPIPVPYYKSKFTLESGSGTPLVMQTAIGQGDTLTTPMHMAMITSAIANGGELMKPMVLEGVESAAGEHVKTYEPSSYKRLMTAEESQILKNLMSAVVTEGTASHLSERDYTVAGKTGTADHGDMQGAPHSWFIGFSNVENPDIAVSIIVEESGTGSEIAVPLARRIFDAYYYE